MTRPARESLPSAPKAPLSLVAPETLAELLELARRSPEGGSFVEVGVYQGGVAWHLANLAIEQGRAVYLYDTFTGIPHRDPIDQHQVGDFADTSLEAVRAVMPAGGALQILAGVFPDSLVPMAPVAFAHIDCDQHAVTAACIAKLSPLMLAGGVMWFDDAPYLAGAKKAVEDAFGRDAGRPLLISRSEKYFVRF